MSGRRRGRSARRASRGVRTLEQALAERAGALVGVLLGPDELGDELGRTSRPAEAHSREEGFENVPRLENDAGAEAQKRRRSLALVAQLAVGHVLDEQSPRPARARRAPPAARPRASRRPGSGSPGSCRAALARHRPRADARAWSTTRPSSSMGTPSTSASKPGTPDGRRDRSAPPRGHAFTLVDERLSEKPSASIAPLVSISPSAGRGSFALELIGDVVAARRACSWAYWNGEASSLGEPAEDLAHGGAGEHAGSGKPPANEITSSAPASARI